MGFFFNKNKHNLTSNNDNSEYSTETVINELQFEVIINHVARKIKRITIDSIDNGEVSCIVDTNSGLSSWTFTVYFNIHVSGMITPDYRIYSENDDSSLPEIFAQQVADLIMKNKENSDYLMKVEMSHNLYCPFCGELNPKENLFCNNCKCKMYKFEEEIAKLKIFKEKTKQEQLLLEKEQLFLERERINRNAEIEKEKTKQAEIDSLNATRTRQFLLSALKIIAPALIVLTVFLTIYSRINSIVQENKIQEDKKIHTVNGEIELKFNDFDFKNTEHNEKNPVKYQSVQADFKNAGFKNVTLIKQKDLGWFDRGKEGNVISVSIDGDKDFKEGDWFSKDAIVTITYHARK